MLQRLLYVVLGEVKRNHLAIALVFVGLGMLGMGSLFIFEGFDHGFRDAVDYLSWWLGTVTTTGFTAMPETFGGRLVDSLFKTPFFLSGFGFLAALFGWIIEAVSAVRKGRGTYSGKGHVLLVGWDEVIRALVEELVRRGEKVVILTDRLEEASDGAAYFVRGDPTLDQDLLRTGVAGASMVIISLEEDGISGLTAASVRRLAPGVQVFVVTVEPENRDRHSETGATSICSTALITDAVQAGLAEPYLAFGEGPIARELRLRGIKLARGNPAVDADLIAAEVKSATVVFVEPESDSHAWLAVASIHAQNPSARIIVTLQREENRAHLLNAGAAEVLCSTEMTVEKIAALTN